MASEDYQKPPRSGSGESSSDNWEESGAGQNFVYHLCQQYHWYHSGGRGWSGEEKAKVVRILLKTRHLGTICGSRGNFPLLKSLLQGIGHGFLDFFRLALRSHMPAVRVELDRLRAEQVREVNGRLRRHHVVVFGNDHQHPGFDGRRGACRRRGRARKPAPGEVRFLWFSWPGF